MSRSYGQTGSSFTPWVIMVVAVVIAIGFASFDRDHVRTTNVVSSTTIRLAPADVPAMPEPTADMRAAAADLDRAAHDAREAAAELNRVKFELEGKQHDLEAMKAQADADAERTRHDLETARSKLESQQASLEKASKEATQRMRSARTDLERLRALAVAQQRRMSTMALESQRLTQQIPAFGPSPAVTMAQAERIAAMGVPRRLSSAELDPKTGEITWPALLTEARYADLTSVIADAFVERAVQGGGFDEAKRQAVEHRIDDVIERLRNNVTAYSSGRYGTARTFLDSLRKECGLPPSS